MLHIWQKYAFIITIMALSLFKKTQGSPPKYPKQKVWGKSKFAYMKLIKIQPCHMGVIFTSNYMTWQGQQCVITDSLIICYHTVNVSWDAVPNVLALIFLTRKQMISIPTPVLQLVFVFIIWLHVVQKMAGFRYPKRKVVESVNRILLH